MPGKIKDRTGHRYGKWTVLRLDGLRYDKAGVGKAMWACRCDCGTERVVAGTCLHNGNSKSCGCVWKTDPGSRKHGQSNSYTYTSWRAMKDRCYNPNQRSFHLYGGRGIRACSEWQTFEGFLASMGERPHGTTLDRIDRDGNYEPANCRWATPAEQAANLPHARRIEHEGKTLSTVAFAREMGIPAATLNWRISKRGQDPHQAAAELISGACSV